MTPRIVTFCNAEYIPVAENWLRALRAINMDRHAIVIALDKEARDAFTTDCVLYRPLPSSAQDLGALWLHRIAVLREILSTGDAVIHSDSDAVWLRNPIPDIEHCGSPIVFSQGTVWPKDVHRRHGFVLCCGFFYLASNPDVLEFLEEVACRVELDRDDQIAVNRIVAERVARWEIEDRYEITFKDSRFIGSRTPMRARLIGENGGELALAVLPHHAYPRVLDEISEETVVAHPLSGKTLDEKVARLSKLSLWSC